MPSMMSEAVRLAIQDSGAARRLKMAGPPRTEAPG